jgi:transcription initiation factor IIE alpha subunit
MVDIFLDPGGRHMVCLNETRRNTQFLLRGNMKICEKCQGSMVVERAVDLEVGLSILYFACLNCGKRIQAEKEPRPLVH